MQSHKSHLERHELAAQALLEIARFGWLRAHEIGVLIYGSDVHASKYAEKLIRKLKHLDLVISRKLPARYAGYAYVLSSQGAKLLNDWAEASHYRSGKDWGSLIEGIWSPPSSWKHDLLAVGTLAHLKWRIKGRIEIYSERTLRGMDSEAPKHADGIVSIYTENKNYSIWLEVENSRKTGRNHNHLVEAIVKASRHTPVHYYDIAQAAPIELGAIAFNPDSIDERGYKINHWQRIETAIQQRGLRADVIIALIKLKVRGVGVTNLSIEFVKIKSNVSAR